MSHQPLIHPVILCGGSGARLWPLSRQSYPKQFSKLMGEQSLFQASAQRSQGTGFAAPVVVTGDAFRFIVTEQLVAIETSPAGILIEPEGRNTPPAILAAALWLEHRDPDALMLVAPSDHVIPDGEAFRSAVLNAADAARAGKLVTFGITPTRAETEYGYLQLEQNSDLTANTPQVLSGFVEKPDATRASQMLAADTYLWNAGIFLFSVRTVLAAFRDRQPELFREVSVAVAQSTNDLGFTRLAAEPWSQVQDISIDYAIMEQADNLVVMLLISTEN